MNPEEWEIKRTIFCVTGSLGVVTIGLNYFYFHRPFEWPYSMGLLLCIMALSTFLRWLVPDALGDPWRYDKKSQMYYELSGGFSRLEVHVSAFGVLPPPESDFERMRLSLFRLIRLVAKWAFVLATGWVTITIVKLMFQT